jgi:hypothetical protein
MLLDLVGVQSGVSSEAQSTSKDVTPLIHTLDTSRPDKYRKRKKDINETSDRGFL